MLSAKLTNQPTNPSTSLRASQLTNYRSGFTLLELMVALSIVSVALIAMLRVVMGNVNATGDARDRTIAANLAMSKLRDIERDPEQQTAENAGNFGEENRYYSWTSATEETRWPELKRIAVTVHWRRGRVTKQLSVETLIRLPEQDTSAEGSSAPQTPGTQTSGAQTPARPSTGRRPR